MGTGGSRTKAAEGTRLSLYDFNIHKMDDDWRGWIRHIKTADLAPPDIVLLQDVERDAEREVFQKALGETFGGNWLGRGSDSEWQTAIVWRGGRFSKMTSRRWGGFGGTGCVDNSQDAPAVQVRIFDGEADKWVSLVSLKTPPQVGDECAGRNFQKVNEHFGGQWDGDLCAIGTDANSPDRSPGGEFAGWYRRSIHSDIAKLIAGESLGFCDPILELCGEDKKKLAEHATLRDTRVDFLFVRVRGRKRPDIVRQETLPRGKPDKWSDHRSVHVEVRY
ncbi:MAG: hypothetical protein M3271_05465 [Actinomycetota bacterium]|nr:hypothetical protein [Actinomycetota bacterium]